MNGLAIEIKSMTTVEIAELTGKRHDNVMRDYENQCRELGLDLLKFEVLERINNLGFKVKDKCYRLPKHECMVLVSGYSVVMRDKIIRRWQELEAPSGIATLRPSGVAKIELENRIAIGQLLGTELNMSRVIAIKAAEEASGLNLQAYQKQIAVTSIPLNPTQLGERLGLTPIKTNKLLAENGLQVKLGRGWEPAEKAAGHYTINPYKADNSDHTGYRILWHESVLDLL